MQSEFDQQAGELKNLLADLSAKDKRTRRNSLLYTLIPLVIGGSLILFSIYEVRRLQKMKQEELGELERIEAQLDKANKDLAQKRLVLETVQDHFAAEAAKQEQSKPILLDIRPKATAEAFKGEKGTFLFSLFLTYAPNVEQEVKNKIKSVTYTFNDDSFRKKERTTEDRASNFRIQYKGWGCLDLVPIAIVFVDGSKTETYLNMCKDLGPDWEN